MKRFGMLFSALFLLSLFSLTAIIHAAPAFTEQFDRDLASSAIFNWTSNSSLPRGTANVTDVAADDDKILRLQIGAGQPANPGNGANIISKQTYHYGTYEARLKTAACPTSEGVINGFFTYANNGGDTNGNGLPDNSEIDFEWLCAEPQSIYLTLWTDYNPANDESRRVFRKINLATGRIEYTRYSTNFGGAYTDLTGAEASPSTVPAIPGYSSASAYYTYGFTWTETSITLWIVNPANGQRITLWDYRGPSARITKVPAAFMANLWHTNSWAPECCPGALNPPAATRNLDIDWLRYTPLGTQPTPTPVPPTATPTPSPAVTLTNPGFEADGATQAPTGWGTWAPTATDYAADFTETFNGARTGAYHLTHYADRPYEVFTYQKRTGLANGTYTVRAWVRSTGGQTAVELQAKEFNAANTILRQAVPTASAWTQVTIANVSVTNGQLVIGFYSKSPAYKYLYVDDVTLVRQ
ncbi:MAG TPA: glycoside hydrolase family 16 protein [Herpetosiphonaceae bacterium]